MIRMIELSKVRLFDGDDPAKLQLKPLTVFCGANSAGKSTILKSLLLLKQSQNLGVPGRLCLAGPQVDFGDYSSFVSHGNTKLNASLAITTDVQMSSSTIDFIRSVKGSAKRVRTKPPSESVAKQCQLRASFVFISGAHGRAALRSSSRPLRSTTSTVTNALLESAVFELSFEQENLLTWKVARSSERSDFGSEHQVLLPSEYFKKVGGFRIMSPDIQDGTWVQAIATLDGLLPQTIVSKPVRARESSRTADKLSESADEWNSYPMPPAIQQALWALESSLENIFYLGPLRSPAKRYYMAHLETELSVDSAGEFLPYVLRDNAQERVSNVLPGEKGKVVRQTLAEALDVWLKYLRTGEAQLAPGKSAEMELHTTKDVLVQISLKASSGKESHALADSGFGYSQVLPILVQGLLADQDSTFIVEQPELHLNPALQIRLAEFFLAMVRAGKQVLIETHSEHIVNAIRVLTAEDESQRLFEKSQIYFIDASESRPVVHELSIRPDGTLPDWPKGFFGEAIGLSGRLLRAQKRFRNLPTKS